MLGMPKILEGQTNENVLQQQTRQPGMRLGKQTVRQLV